MERTYNKSHFFKYTHKFLVLWYTSQKDSALRKGLSICAYIYSDVEGNDIFCGKYYNLIILGEQH